MVTAASTEQNKDWFGTQQQYWDAWFDQQRKFFGGQGQTAPSGMQGPWADFFKEWQDTVFSGGKAANTEAFGQYFAKAGEQYLNMMQQFYQATGQAKPLDQMTKEWTDTLQKFFSGAFQANSQPFDVSGAYQSFMDSAAKMGQGLAPGFQSGKNPFSNFDPLGSFTSMPGLGYTREKQDELNRLYHQWVEYQQKSRAYDAAMSKVGLDAVRKFQEFLANPPEGQEPLKSLKEIYTKWVDVCEDIYAKYAMSDEYIALYGETVNALMAFKKQQNKLTDDMLGQLNMPTRKEIDSLHERMHALRRENIQMKKDIAELKAALKPAAAKPVNVAKKGKKS